LLDWQRYYEQYGFGVDRDDIHWGMLLSMLYNIHKSKDAPAKKATDFMPYYDSPDISDDQFAEQMNGLFASLPST
jgi:hypothetical protein